MRPPYIILYTTKGALHQTPAAPMAYAKCIGPSRKKPAQDDKISRRAGKYESVFLISGSSCRARRGCWGAAGRATGFLWSRCGRSSDPECLGAGWRPASGHRPLRLELLFRCSRLCRRMGEDCYSGRTYGRGLTEKIVPYRCGGDRRRATGI